MSRSRSPTSSPDLNKALPPHPLQPRILRLNTLDYVRTATPSITRPLENKHHSTTASTAYTDVTPPEISPMSFAASHFSLGQKSQASQGQHAKSDLSQSSIKKKSRETARASTVETSPRSRYSFYPHGLSERESESFNTRSQTYSDLSPKRPDT